MPTLRRRLKAPALCVPKKKLPEVGDVVDVLWEDRDTYFRGALQKRVKHGFWFMVAYFDGDRKVHNLDDEYWSLVDGDEFEPGELERIQNEAVQIESDVKQKSGLVDDQAVMKALPLKVRFKRERRKAMETSAKRTETERAPLGSRGTIGASDLVHIPVQPVIRKREKEKRPKSNTKCKLSRKVSPLSFFQQVQNVSSKSMSSPQAGNTKGTND